MIVRGIGGRDVLANTLKSRGAVVTFAECYQRINPQSDCDLLTKAYAQQQLQSIIVTSSEAMRHLLRLAHNAAWLQDITICVNHARVAEQPLAMGLKVIIADAPGDEAMMDLLLNNAF
jgi:uroporphyrinogen-III synthase